ncbi:RNA polymerase [Virgisporangium aliadipatigenens]|uniref:RNA polymerase n=1 Tax=Virgisporangium aliadipatigenens TaxID=741659 RepID=A0A8J3YT27_9ACTN|nr:SigE family RNA polymerase sigma factor [Virgisporangium aliadipatigenens]GIJ50087.1 RNA polymerase [Virgisporangium aliadipatigenens]
MAFEEFAAHRLPALLRYAVLLTGDRELARDLVQEVLTKALVRWRRIERLDDPYAYVRAMTTNAYLSILRRRRLPTVALTYEALDGPRAPAAPDPVVALHDRAELWQRLTGLPRKQRAVLVLRYYEGLTDNEIAEVLHCRPSSVRAFAARGLATLRAGLVHEGRTP